MITSWKLQFIEIFLLFFWTECSPHAFVPLCFFKCYVPVIIIDLQRLSASEQIPGLFSQVLSWGTALRYSDGTNKGSEWDLEPRRVSRVKTMERLQCQGKGFGFDYPVQGSIRHFRPGL